ncbi:hypothetical protein TSUD_157200 [Trifolium subterraneum]|uniref:ribose-phosphate diphosphokinase n=1 Tax=Trifolium subterraneum TaxID=3900 RepID=A0A2Z6N6H1_TRISU|nr:hypothetical protein TSUD_157200 [Trifolium subterraneum]
MASSLFQVQHTLSSSSSSSTIVPFPLCKSASHPLTFRTLGFLDLPRTRTAAYNTVKCDMSEPSNLVNGKPIVPVINEKTLPKSMESATTDKIVSRNASKLKLFSGTANPTLSQPTSPPANENVMELQIMIDACRRASAKNITAVIPYFGYARADRKASILYTQGRESIAAKLVANLITKAGADRVLACDLHSGQSMGYFDIPVDHVHCQPVILDYLASKTISSNDLVVVSPDVGGVARARAFAKKLSDAPLAIIDKRRHGHNLAEVMNLIGDVKGKVAVMVDDMIDTAGTIAKGAALLHEEGAREVYACCTHGVFSPPAIERLSSGLFQEVIITNTIPVAEKNYFPQLTILTVANLLGETIWRIHDDSSVSSIFQ